MKPDRNKYVLTSDFFEEVRGLKALLRGEVKELRDLVMSIEKRFKESLLHRVVTEEGLRKAANTVRGRRLIEEGQRLKILRKTLGLNQQELAYRFEKTPTLISMMESGKRSAAKIIKLIESESRKQSKEA